MSNDAHFTVAVGYRDEQPWDDALDADVQRILCGKPINGYHGVTIDAVGPGADGHVLLLQGWSKRLCILDKAAELRAQRPELEVSCFGWIDGQSDLFWDDPAVGSGTAPMLMWVGGRVVEGGAWSTWFDAPALTPEAVVPLG